MRSHRGSLVCLATVDPSAYFEAKFYRSLSQCALSSFIFYFSPFSRVEPMSVQIIVTQMPTDQSQCSDSLPQLIFIAFLARLVVTWMISREKLVFPGN